MAAVSWHQSLDLARSEHEVLNVVREFVASLDPYQLAQLPAACRPGKFFDADDITSFAFDVIRHHCDEVDATRDLVQRIGAFFSYASTRLSQIMASPIEGNEVARSA